MKKKELQLQSDGFIFNANLYPAKSHYKFIMKLGRCLPNSKAQAIYFINSFAYMNLDVLNFEDVERIESILNKHGYAGDYKKTKSGQWCRLQNYEDLKQAFKKEYNLN